MSSSAIDKISKTVDDEGIVRYRRMKKLLKTGDAGVKAWNAWRAEDSGQRLTIEDFEFDNLKLNGINFSNCILKSGSMANTELERATFDKSHIQDVSLQRSCLNRASFEEAIIGNTRDGLWTFYKTAMASVNMKHAHIDHCEFHTCDLRNTVFDEAQFKDVRFQYGKLMHSSFICAQVVESSRLTFSMTNLDDTSWRELSGNVVVMGSDMRNACLDKTRLSGAYQDRSCFDAVTLTDASFKNTDWSSVHIGNSDILNADFSGARLQNVRFKDNERLLNTKFEDTHLKSCSFEANQNCDLKPEFMEQAAAPEGIHIIDKETQEKIRTEEEERVSTAELVF